MLYYINYDAWYKSGKWSYGILNTTYMIFKVIRHNRNYKYNVIGREFVDL